MAVLFVARSAETGPLGLDVGFGKHVYKVGVSADDPRLADRRLGRRNRLEDRAARGGRGVDRGRGDRALWREKSRSTRSSIPS